MLLELHSHTLRHSPCSVLDPVILVKQVIAKELQGLVITEHAYLWTSEELAALRSASEVNDHFVLLAAQEVSVSGFGHVVVFGATRSITEKVTIEELRAEFPHAALIWAHPFRDGHIPKPEKLTHPLIDGVEIFSLNHTAKENFLGLQAWHAHKFTAVSGSDAHSIEMAGVFPTLFDHPVKTMDDIVCEIKHNRCRPLVKEIPKAGSTMVVTEVTIGTKGADETRSRIIVKHVDTAVRWKKEAASADVSKAIYRRGFDGGMYRVPKIIDMNHDDRMLIEEGQRGKSLYDILLQVHSSVGLIYYAQAGVWLGRLHALKIEETALSDTRKKEDARWESYIKTFTDTKSPYVQDITAFVDIVRSFEEICFKKESKRCVQLHGDYHPKNIIIGQDKMQDMSTLFVSVIDFGNSFSFLPSFDVGYFLAQFQSQYMHAPHIIATYGERVFLDAYYNACEERSSDRPRFEREIALFMVRANLSIGNYLVKVGKGESPEMKALVERSHSIISTLKERNNL